MAGTTTNNGWTYPTSTDLVTNGATAIQTLATGIDTSVGTGLLAWKTNWAPTMTGWTGAGTWQTAWVQIGKIVHVQGKFTPSSTTGIGQPTITLPVNAKVSGNQPFLAHLVAGGTNTIGGGRITSTSQFIIYALNTASTYLGSATISSTVPGTWATSGDSFAFAFTYEAA